MSPLPRQRVRGFWYLLDCDSWIDVRRAVGGIGIPSIASMAYRARPVSPTTSYCSTLTLYRMLTTSKTTVEREKD
jgi:hypothetical protein